MPKNVKPNCQHQLPNDQFLQHQQISKQKKTVSVRFRFGSFANFQALGLDSCSWKETNMLKSCLGNTLVPWSKWRACISTGYSDETGTQLLVTINVAKGEKKGPSTILWYSVLDSKICVKDSKSIYISKYLFTPLRSRGCPQRFARLSSSHSDLMLGVAKPCVLLHLCACKSNKHQMQTARQNTETLLFRFLGPPFEKYCYLSCFVRLARSGQSKCPRMFFGPINCLVIFLRLLRRSQNMARCQDVSTMQEKRTAFISSNLNSPQMPWITPFKTYPYALPA